MAEGFRSGFGMMVTQAVTPATVKVAPPKLFVAAGPILAEAKKSDVMTRFETALNDTVARVVPKAADELRNSLKGLKIEDTHATLAGSKKAGTEFWQKAAQGALRDALLPVIRREMTATELTGKANAVLNAAHPAGVRGGTAAVGTLDYHIRDRVAAECFRLIGEREAAVRADPTLLKGNTLAQAVFSAQKK